MSTTLFSLAFGVGTQNRQGAWLEVFYAAPLLKPSAEIVAAIAPVLGYSEGNQAITFTTAQAAELADALKSIDAFERVGQLRRLGDAEGDGLVAFGVAQDRRNGSDQFCRRVEQWLCVEHFQPGALTVLSADTKGQAEQGSGHVDTSNKLKRAAYLSAAA